MGKGKSKVNKSEFRICFHCNTELDDDNWCKSRQKRDARICDNCRCEQDRIGRLILKQEIINHYGGKCKCCGIENIKFLTVDHIDGSGAKHRREQDNIAGSDMHRWLKKNNFPNNFRILCWNCNFSMGMRGYCPHKDHINALVNYDDKKEILKHKNANRISNHKIELLNAYGGQVCVCCNETKVEFLSLDHKFGGGAEHRRKTNKYGYSLYNYLRVNSFPDKDQYQILCMNCNAVKGLWGHCPHEEHRNIASFREKSNTWMTNDIAYIKDTNV